MLRAASHVFILRRADAPRLAGWEERAALRETGVVAAGVNPMLERSDRQRAAVASLAAAVERLAAVAAQLAAAGVGEDSAGCDDLWGGEGAAVGAEEGGRLAYS